MVISCDRITCVFCSIFGRCTRKSINMDKDNKCLSFVSCEVLACIENGDDGDFLGE